ncbi:MAG: M48 family metallopeptidase, partial [Syntrophaceae bacterium]|nr:M48 family metallopeptidase [Syntrophaceae bacterium]
MPKPGEHKTVQSRILNYAQEIGWTFVPRSDAEQRRGFNSEGGTIGEQAANASLYFDDLLHSKAREFNPKYNEAKGGLTGRLTFDALLPELDEELQDYVIVHELLHSR